jgi:hypothetical protein
VISHQFYSEMQLIYAMIASLVSAWGVPPNPATYTVSDPKRRVFYEPNPDGTCQRYLDFPRDCIFADDLNVMQPSSGGDDWLYA